MTWLLPKLLFINLIYKNHIFPLTIYGITILLCIFDSFILNKLYQVILLIFSASIAFVK